MNQRPENAEPFLSLKQLGFQYASQAIVDRLDLQVPAGTYLVVLGRSGVGKSTLLKLVAGLLSPVSGDICVAGQSVNQVPPHQRDVALHFQHDPLYPHRTIGSTLQLAEEKADAGDSFEDDGFEGLAERLGISDCLDRRPGALSGGQLRRCGLARTLLRSAAVTLLDEALTAVDSVVRDSMLDELLRLKQRLRQPTSRVVMHVTHDAVTAMRLADQIAILGEGHILQCADPYTVYNQPSCLAVANALSRGPLNVISYQNVQRLGFGGSSEGCLPRSAADTFLIRPEYVRLSTASKEGNACNLMSVCEVRVRSVVEQQLGLGCWHVRFQPDDATIPPIWATVSPTELPAGGFEAVERIWINQEHVLAL